MFCTNCGSELTRGSVSCAGCGADVPEWQRVANPDGETAARTRPGVEKGLLRGVITAKWVIGLLVAVALVDLVAIFADLSIISLAQDTWNGNPVSRSDALDSKILKMGVYVVYLILFMITGGCFLTWMYRVCLNLGALGQKAFPWAPQMVIGCWFVPAANIFLPAVMIFDIWRASDPDRVGKEEWSKKPGTTLILFWWLLFLISVSASFYSVWLLRLPNPGVVLQASLLMLFGDVLIIPAVILTILVILGINERQKVKAEAMSLV